MANYELTCPHARVPLVLMWGDTLRGWRLALTDAQHRLSASADHLCDAGEMQVRLVATEPPTSYVPRRRGPWGLVPCHLPGCPGVALDQRDGATTGLTCYAHSEHAQRPPRMQWTTAQRLAVRP